MSEHVHCKICGDPHANISNKLCADCTMAEKLLARFLTFQKGRYRAEEMILNAKAEFVKNLKPLTLAEAREAERLGTAVFYRGVTSGYVEEVMEYGATVQILEDTRGGIVVEFEALDGCGGGEMEYDSCEEQRKLVDHMGEFTEGLYHLPEGVLP